MRQADAQKGFTLLEILVAIGILAVILGVVYSTFFSASKASRILESDEDVYQTGRSLTGMLSRELRALYFYQDSKTRKGFGLSGVDREADGHPADEIYFLTTSYRRSRPDAKEGTLAEIGYFFDVEAISGEKRLIKSQDPTVDLDLKKGGDLLVLTDRIEEMNITYYRADRQEWLNRWDMETENALPDLIRIELSVLDDEDRPARFRMTVEPMLRRQQK